MRAIILAGGKGTRLKPYTTVLPKPLLPIDNMCILEIVIRQLKSHGFTHITLTVNHLAEIIMAFFGNGEKWDIKIDYSVEAQPMGTIGPLTLIKDLPEHFLMMNGDIFTDFDFRTFAQTHIAQDKLFSVATCCRKNMVDFGVMYFGEDHKLTDFEEKPVSHFNVSAGIYMINRKALDHVPKQEPFGFDDIMHKFLEKNEPVDVYPFDGFWLDIGRPDDYERAVEKFSQQRDHFLNGCST